MISKKWRLKEKAPQEFVKKYADYSLIVSQLLFDRGLLTKGQINRFLNPDYIEDLYDPFLLQGMKKAVKRIKEAVEKKEKIAIFGDYDADGVTSTVLLVETFERMGLDVVSYILVFFYFHNPCS